MLTKATSLWITTFDGRKYPQRFIWNAKSNVKPILRKKWKSVVVPLFITKHPCLESLYRLFTITFNAKFLLNDPKYVITPNDKNKKHNKGLSEKYI